MLGDLTVATRPAAGRARSITGKGYVQKHIPSLLWMLEDLTVATRPAAGRTRPITARGYEERPQEDLPAQQMCRRLGIFFAVMCLAKKIRENP